MLKIKTYDEIMADVLARFPDKYDKRQGSTLWNLCAPLAQELAIQYAQLEDMERQFFLDTSEGDFLTRLAAQFGVTRLPATSAIREVHFQETVPIGTRFSVVDTTHNFRVLERKPSGEYLLIAETPGKEANGVDGSLINIDVLQEFSGAILGNVVVPGEDIESDDALRVRATKYIKTPTLNGNLAQYEKWADEFEGVGSVFMQPLHAGPNTLKLSITNANGEEASAELVKRFQDFLDPEPKGHGKGVAPIGAYVTVQSVRTQEVTIAADIKIKDDAEIEVIKADATKALANYLKTEAFQEKEVRSYKVATIIDRVHGVKDVDNLLINGTTNSVELPVEILPKLREVTLNVR